MVKDGLYKALQLNKSSNIHSRGASPIVQAALRSYAPEVMHLRLCQWSLAPLVACTWAKKSLQLYSHQIQTATISIIETLHILNIYNNRNTEIKLVIASNVNISTYFLKEVKAKAAFPSIKKNSLFRSLNYNATESSYYFQNESLLQHFS